MVTLTPEHAIGVFDSGVGGLTVLDECLAQLPAEDFIYFGDTAWFPYGDRSDAQLRARAELIAVWLDRSRGQDDRRRVQYRHRGGPYPSADAL